MTEIFRPFINYHIDEKMFQIIKKWEQSGKVDISAEDQEYLNTVLKDHRLPVVLFGDIYRFTRQFYREMYWRSMDSKDDS